MQIYKYTNIKIYKCTNIQIYKYTNKQIYKYTKFELFFKLFLIRQNFKWFIVSKFLAKIIIKTQDKKRKNHLKMKMSSTRNRKL